VIIVPRQKEVLRAVLLASSPSFVLHALPPYFTFGPSSTTNHYKPLTHLLTIFSIPSLKQAYARKESRAALSFFSEARHQQQASSSPYLLHTRLSSSLLHDPSLHSTTA